MGLPPHPCFFCVYGEGKVLAGHARHCVTCNHCFPWLADCTAIPRAVTKCNDKFSLGVPRENSGKRLQPRLSPVQAAPVLLTPRHRPVTTNKLCCMHRNPWPSPALCSRGVYKLLESCTFLVVAADYAAVDLPVQTVATSFGPLNPQSLNSPNNFGWNTAPNPR